MDTASDTAWYNMQGMDNTLLTALYSTEDSCNKSPPELSNKQGKDTESLPVQISLLGKDNILATALYNIEDKDKKYIPSHCNKLDKDMLCQLLLYKPLDRNMALQIVLWYTEGRNS